MGAVRHWLVITLTIGILSIAALSVAYCRPKPAPIPRTELRTIDSLAITQAAYDSGLKANTRVESIFVATSAQKARTATISTRTADSIAKLANLAQRLAEAATDSLSALSRWRDVATLRGVENDSLRSSNASLFSALTEQIGARSAADVRANEAERRLAAVDDLNRRVVSDLRRADPPCRVLWVARCPSRRVAFASGLVVASAGAYVVTHRSLLTGLAP